MEDHKVAILTDFSSDDQAYSIWRVVQFQILSLIERGTPVLLLVRGTFPIPERLLSGGLLSVKVIETSLHFDNVVKVSSGDASGIDKLAADLEESLADYPLVFTHDLLSQPAQWQYRIAAQRVAEQLPSLKWIHWVHSLTAAGIPGRVGVFSKEITNPFPNSRLVIMNPEVRNMVASYHGFEIEQCLLLPNPVDITEDMHPIAAQIARGADLARRDLVLVYQARLDRGKQPEVVAKIAAAANQLGYNAIALIIDGYADGGAKRAYKKSLKKRGKENIIFSSDLSGEYTYPHKVLTDLFGVSDFLVHPSRSENDSMILQEAKLAGLGLLLNFDLLPFRRETTAIWGKFSSNIDVATGDMGSTDTKYSNEAKYFEAMAAAVVQQTMANSILSARRATIKERDISGKWGDALNSLVLSASLDI